MRTARLSHDRDRFRLHVSDMPLWAQLAEDLTERVCTALRHPRACRLVARGAMLAGGRERPLLELPLSPSQARALDPAFVDRWAG